VFAGELAIFQALLYFTPRRKGAKKKERVLVTAIFKKSVQISRIRVIRVLIVAGNLTH